ncbi:MAG: acetyltransferase [Bacteroidales bacterium]|nr:acetyltransferase [Bacteroidales bacterium]
MESIILIGGGGHCISCIDVLRLENKYEIAGILDTFEKGGTEMLGIKVIGTDDDIPMLAAKYRNFLITIGQIKSPEKRVKIFELVKNYNGSLPVIISPRAYVSASAIIEEGTIVMHDSLINARAQIGKNCIINTGALIEHEAIVGDNCHISTQSVINGQVIVGNNSFVGSNSVIANNISLPENIIVAAGACILKNPDEPGLYIGNPARKVLKS